MSIRRRLPRSRHDEHGGPPLETTADGSDSIGHRCARRLLPRTLHQHVCVDLSEQCSVHAPGWPRRSAPIRRSSRSRDDTADVVLLINVLLSPARLDRIVQPGDHVDWIDPRRPDTVRLPHRRRSRAALR